MIHIWKNTYNESMSKFFARTLKNKNDIDVLNMLWGSFRLTFITQSSFFKSIRIGDDKHSLLVRKEQNGVITIKFVIQ